MTLLDALAPLEAALRAHHRGDGADAAGTLRLAFDDGEVQEVPVAWFFRTEEAFDALDRAAVDRARGRVLDVGACAGAHALALLDRGHEVTALEILPGAVRVLRERGVEDARLESLADHAAGRPYDTVLLLMNGTGLAGTLAGLAPLLDRVTELLAEGGRLLVDSTDPGDAEPGDGRHPGELQIQLEYRGRRGAPFPHLYVGREELAAAARNAGLTFEVVAEVETEVEAPRYLALCRRPGGVTRR